MKEQNCTTDNWSAGTTPMASRTAMRRSDRAVAVMARRTPWILRGMARLTPAASRSSIRRATTAGEGISVIALSAWPGGDQRAAVVVDHRRRRSRLEMTVLVMTPPEGRRSVEVGEARATVDAAA